MFPSQTTKDESYNYPYKVFNKRFGVLLEKALFMGDGTPRERDRVFHPASPPLPTTLCEIELQNDNNQSFLNCTSF